MSQIRVGKLSFEVWSFADGRIAFDYKTGSKRKVIARKTLAELKAAAELVATKILNGETESIALSPQACRIHIAAEEALRPLGMHVDAAARDLAEAQKIAPGISARELALFFRRNQRGDLMRAIVPDVVNQLVKAKKLRGVSEKFYLRQVRQDLEHFAESFTGPIDEIQARQLVDYIAQFDVGWRRRNKLRANLILLFRFAKRHKHLEPDRETEADKVDRIDPIYTRPRIFYPRELRLILEHIRDEWLPWCVIQSFAGARTEEIKRLSWSDVHWERKLIHISAGVSKTGRRTGKDGWLPMPDNLVRWLEPWRESVGPICKLPEQSRETERLKKVTGLKWKQDILRHSFGSYCTALHGIDETLKIMRHDRQTCERHYLNRKITEEEAGAWFASYPFARPGNVIQTSFPLRFA